MEILGPNTPMPSQAVDIEVSKPEDIPTRIALAAFDNMQNYLLGRRDSFHFYFDLTTAEHVQASILFQEYANFHLDDPSLQVIQSGQDRINDKPIDYQIIDVAQHDGRLVRAKKQSFTYEYKEEGKAPVMRTDEAVMFYGVDARALAKTAWQFTPRDFH